MSYFSSKMLFAKYATAFILSFAMVCTLLAGVNVVAFAADDDDLIVSVHSFYNDAEKGGDGEHLFTKDADEMSWLSSLPTWNDEGESWKAPVSSSLAVYRVYNPNSGEHHYAAADEASWLVSQGWTQEKIAFYSDDNMGVPVYRLWNGLDGVGSHYYTTDEGEASWLASIGWQAEGVNFYGVKEEEPGEKEMIAAQTGANEITVISTTEFTELEQFTVKKGSIDQALASDPIFIDENTAVLYLASDITDDEYTVICSDEEYAPSSFEGEVAELTTVEIGDNLIKDSVEENTYNVHVKTLDQFGDEFEVEEWDGATSSVGTVGDDAWDAENGVLTVTGVTDQMAATVKSSIITLIKGTTVASKEVPFSAESTPKVVMTSPIMMTEAEQLMNTSGRIDVDDLQKSIDLGDMPSGYFYGVIAYDQYDQQMDAAQLNIAVANSSLVVVGNGILEPIDVANGATPSPVYFVEDPTSGAALMFVTNTTDVAGPGTITFIPVANTAAQSQATLTVAENEKIASITVSEGADKLQQGAEVPVVVTAVNNYGETVDMNTEVVGVKNPANTMTLNYRQGGIDPTTGQPKTHSTVDNKSSIKLTYGEWAAWEAPTLTTPAVYAIKADGDATRVIAVATAASSAEQFTFTVNKAATVAGIYGFTPATLGGNLKTTVPYGIAGSANTNIDNETNILLRDQYNKLIEDPAAYANLVFGGKAGVTTGAAIDAGKYVYTVEASGSTSGTQLDNNGDIVYKARTTTNATKDTYIVKLWVVGEDGVPAGRPVSKTYAKELDTYKLVINVAAKDYAMYTAMTYDAVAAANNAQVARDTLYTADLDSNNSKFDTMVVGVVGIDAAGNMIQLEEDEDYFVVLRDDKVAGATLHYSDTSVTHQDVGLLTVAAEPVQAGTFTETAYLDIYDMEGEYLTTVEVECSNAARETVAFACTATSAQGTVPYDLDQGINLSAAGITGVYAEAVKGHETFTIDDTAAEVEYTIVAVDQYGLSSFDNILFKGQDASYDTTGGGTLSLTSGSISKMVKITAPAV